MSPERGRNTCELQHGDLASTGWKIQEQHMYAYLMPAATEGVTLGTQLPYAFNDQRVIA